MSPNRGRGRRSRATIAGIAEPAEAEQHEGPGRGLEDGGGHDNLDAASGDILGARIAEEDRRDGLSLKTGVALGRIAPIVCSLK